MSELQPFGSTDSREHPARGNWQERYVRTLQLAPRGFWDQSYVSAPVVCRTLCRGRTPQRWSLLSCQMRHPASPLPGQANLTCSLSPGAGRAAADGRPAQLKGVAECSSWGIMAHM